MDLYVGTTGSFRISYDDAANGVDINYFDQTSGNLKWATGVWSDSYAGIPSLANAWWVSQGFDKTETVVNAYRLVIDDSGNVGIGTTTPDEKLVVSGNIKATGNFISGATTLTVPDYVFEEDYPLMPLDELRAFVASEKHLPNVPSAADIEEDGLNI